MNNRRFLIKASVFSALIAAAGAPVKAQAAEPIPVVATFSILADMVERVGGDAVQVTSLVGRNGDTHVYQPTPADARAVKKAEILFTNGLEFEGWLDRLAEAAEFNGELVVTTQGMAVIAFEENHDDHHEDHDSEKHDGHDHDKHDDHDGDKHDEHDHDKQDEHDHDKHDDHDGHDHHDHGEYDPHAWQSLRNAVVYVDNITAALAKSSPVNAATFYANRAAYVADIEALDNEIKAMISNVAPDARTVVTSHDAFQYFGRDYGVEFVAPQGLSTESEASARDVANLIKQIRSSNISAVFVENVTDPRLITQVANETGAAVGGKLFPGALSKVDGPAATYLDLMRHNATTIATALSQTR